MVFVKFVYYLVQSIPVTLEVVFSGGSRPPDKGGGGGWGGGNPDPEIKRGTARSPFWSKNKGEPGPPGPSPGSVSGFVFVLYFVPKTSFHENRPFPCSPGPLYQNEIKYFAFDMEMIFHCYANKTHAFSQERLCTWPHFESEGFFELGRGLLKIALLW